MNINFRYGSIEIDKEKSSVFLININDDFLSIVTHRPIRLTQCCTQFKSPGDKILCVLYLHWHSHLNDMEIPETKRFIPEGFELGTTLS